MIFFHVSERCAGDDVDFASLGQGLGSVGGYFGVLADVALAFAAMSSVEEEEMFKTSDLRLSFFKPVTRGSTIEIEAVVVNRSRSLLHVEATFRGENDVLLANAAGVFAVLPYER